MPKDRSKKADKEIYEKVKDKIPQAITNAEKVRKYKIESSPPNYKIYELNPYTDVDELLKAIDKIKELYK